jgi:hypothetical protein
LRQWLEQALLWHRRVSLILVDAINLTLPARFALE